MVVSTSRMQDSSPRSLNNAYLQTQVKICSLFFIQSLGIPFSAVQTLRSLDSEQIRSLRNFEVSRLCERETDEALPR